MAVGLVPRDKALFSLRGFDLRALWRLAAWGAAAAIALIAAAFATRTETGSRRLAALASAELPVRAVATVQIPKQDAQIVRLETELRSLAVDRDRLAERVASLERSVEDITGSIKRVERATRPEMPPILSMIPTPTVREPATVPLQLAPAPSSAQPQPPAGPSADNDSDAATPSPPDKGSEPVRESVPLPPARVATLEEPAKAEFGVALASSSNLDVLQLQWAALKANYGQMLAGLRPIAAKERQGAVTRYRLILGPLPNLASAARLCARLTAARAPCHAGKYSGDPL